MLRFRPILPKPTTTEGALSVGTQNVVVCKRRPKRKYVRVRRKNGYAETNGKRFKKRETPDQLEDTAALVTLQLMPEKDSPEEGTSLAGVSRSKNVGLELDDLTLDNSKPPWATTENANAGEGLDLVTAEGKAVVVESWVTVESVTGTCIGEGEGGGLGCTDVEKVKNLETDTCPGFISDGYCRVRWVNDAFKRMVESEEREVVVWLKVKDGAAAAIATAGCYPYRAFTCGVRWQYTWRDEKCTKMVPCDVWRLDCGGFAWRLDVKAALSLGL